VQTIPILTYHSIGRAPADGRLCSLYVSPGKFARQMALLRALGFQGLSMSAALPYLRGERSGRIVAITFDDGYVDNFEVALPILQRYGFSATCYVTSGVVGRYNTWDAAEVGVRKPVMDATQLRAWQAARMEVGAHTRTHAPLPALDDAHLDDEVVGSRRDLENLLGAEVPQFSYPYGAHDQRVVDAVRRAGFAAATTTHRGRARPGDDLFRLRRVVVAGANLLHQMLLKVLTRYEDRRG
jgi:peptidoglycan/xylan/chitin deacetylase (PgdA/CDA1 family)